MWIVEPNASLSGVNEPESLIMEQTDGLSKGTNLLIAAWGTGGHLSPPLADTLCPTPVATMHHVATHQWPPFDTEIDDIKIHPWTTPGRNPLQEIVENCAYVTYCTVMLFAKEW